MLGLVPVARNGGPRHLTETHGHDTEAGWVLVQGLVEHAFADVFGIAVAVGEHVLDRHALFWYGWSALVQGIMTNGCDRRDELEAHFVLRRAVSRDESCKVDEVAKDAELRGEGQEGLFSVHWPRIVDNVGHFADERIVGGRRESKVWLCYVDLKDDELRLRFWREDEVF